MYNHGEADGRSHPVVIAGAFHIRGPPSVTHGEVEADSAMPQAKEDPTPKDTIVEVVAELPWFVDLWESERVVKVHILLKQESKEAMPAGEYCVIEHRKPVQEKYLAGKSIEEGEIEFS